MLTHTNAYILIRTAVLYFCLATGGAVDKFTGVVFVIIRLFGSYERNLRPTSLPLTTLCDFMAVNNQLHVCGPDTHVSARELSWPRQADK